VQYCKIFGLYRPSIISKRPSGFFFHEETFLFLYQTLFTIRNSLQLNLCSKRATNNLEAILLNLPPLCVESRRFIYESDGLKWEQKGMQLTAGLEEAAVYQSVL